MFSACGWTAKRRTKLLRAFGKCEGQRAMGVVGDDDMMVMVVGREVSQMPQTAKPLLIAIHVLNVRLDENNAYDRSG